VIEAREEQLKQMEAENPRGIAVIEAALLIENGYYKKLDRLVVCSSRPDQQLARLCARGFTAEQARQRIESQMGLAEKLRLADDVVDCSGTLEETLRQTDTLVARLRELAEAHHNKQGAVAEAEQRGKEAAGG